jgi:hypothetical protein
LLESCPYFLTSCSQSRRGCQEWGGGCHVPDPSASGFRGFSRLLLVMSSLTLPSPLSGQPSGSELRGNLAHLSLRVKCAICSFELEGARNSFPPWFGAWWFLSYWLWHPACSRVHRCQARVGCSRSRGVRGRLFSSQVDVQMVFRVSSEFQRGERSERPAMLYLSPLAPYCAQGLRACLIV